MFGQIHMSGNPTNRELAGFQECGKIIPAKPVCALESGSKSLQGSKSIGGIVKIRIVVTVGLLVALPVGLFILNYGQAHYPALTRTGPLPGVSGTLQLGILEAGSPLSTLWVYEVSPANGAVAVASSRQMEPSADLNSEPLPDGAHVSNCSHQSISIRSPNGRYDAACRKQDSNESYSVVIEDSASGRPVKTVPVEKFFNIGGIAWSPDSNAVTILKESERMGYGPLDLLAALSGHPVPYVTVGFVTVKVGENGGQGLPYVGREFRAAWTFVKWSN
jgi:hypothetical protein